MRTIAFVAALCVAAVAFSGCNRGDDTVKVSLDKREAAERGASPEGPALRIAVGGMITPKEGFAYYKKFLDYIGDKTGQRVKFVDREDYAEINRLVKRGEVDVAFVCGGPYVDGRKDFGMELLAAPRAYGGTVYYSYIIVSKDSPIKDFAGLRGKRFAFTDPLSNTGKLVPTFMLARMGETPEKFFSEIVFTKSHDKSIKAVAQGLADGAAVDSLIWEYGNRVNPEFTSKTRIIRKSPPYGIPPVVVRPGLDPRLRERLRAVLLQAHDDPGGREILNGMMIERFVKIDDKAYDSIREMKAWIDARNPDKK